MPKKTESLVDLNLPPRGKESLTLKTTDKDYGSILIRFTGSQTRVKVNIESCKDLVKMAARKKNSQLAENQIANLAIVFKNSIENQYPMWRYLQNINFFVVILLQDLEMKVLDAAADYSEHQFKLKLQQIQNRKR